METLISELRKARKKKGMTQARLSHSVGLPQSHISDIEQGKKDPRISTIIQIARILGYEITLIPHQLDAYVKSIIEEKEDVEIEPRFQPDQEEL